jgi:ABC-2 type transport system ATP-binding protein
MTMESIEVRGVSMSSGRKIRLDHVSLVLKRGRVYGLVGPNGAGKSTLLSVVAGLSTPERGSVVRSGPGATCVALDTRDLHPARSVLESIRLVAMLRGIDASSVAPLLSRCGLAEVRKQRVRTLSLGMRVRLSLAIALLDEPALLLLDEPMNGLDPDGIAWVRTIVSEVAASGGIVVVSSHLLVEIESLADEVLVMSQGRVVSTVRPREELIGSTISVADGAALVAGLRALGHDAAERNGRVVSALPVAELAPVAVALGAEILEITPQRGQSLQATFDAMTVSEFAAKER